MQVKLLRVLQDHRYERVGSTETLEADVRIIAATNRDLARLVRRGRFREDLYYRLNVVRIELPPLRERPEDIPLLATHFVTKYTRPGEVGRPISPAAMDRLVRYGWPGNVRELENAIERACVTARGEKIDPDDLPLDGLRSSVESNGVKVDLTRPLPDLVREMTTGLETQYLKRALRKCRGHVGRCARLAGLSRRSISAKLTEYGIDKGVFKGDDSA
jgi:DNA-binding NtrC family response regulator